MPRWRYYTRLTTFYNDYLNYVVIDWLKSGTTHAEFIWSWLLAWIRIKVEWIQLHCPTTVWITTVTRFQLHVTSWSDLVSRIVGFVNHIRHGRLDTIWRKFSRPRPDKGEKIFPCEVGKWDILEELKYNFSRSLLTMYELYTCAHPQS